MSSHSTELLILDVDGVLTRGHVSGLPVESAGRRFHVQDGCAVKLWRRGGGKVALLSGRSGEDIAARAAELGIDWVVTDADDKVAAYDRILKAAELSDDAVAYVGDDIPDLRPMMRCGFPVAVANAVPAVKQAAMYVTRRGGGDGAVAEVVELLLRRCGRWSRAWLLEGTSAHGDGDLSG